MARKPRPSMTCTITPVIAEAASQDRAAGLAMFLLETTGSIFGTWNGQMSATQQQTLLGRFLGKGRIHIYGEEEVVVMTVSVSFGTMHDTRFRASWADLQREAA